MYTVSEGLESRRNLIGCFLLRVSCEVAFKLLTGAAAEGFIGLENPLSSSPVWLLGGSIPH